MARQILTARDFGMNWKALKEGMMHSFWKYFRGFRDEESLHRAQESLLDIKIENYRLEGTREIMKGNSY